jgi:hypothetical protein
MIPSLKIAKNWLFFKCSWKPVLEEFHADIGNIEHLEKNRTQQLVEHPVLGGVQTLHVLLRSTSLLMCKIISTCRWVKFSKK